MKKSSKYLNLLALIAWFFFFFSILYFASKFSIFSYVISLAFLVIFGNLFHTAWKGNRLYRAVEAGNTPQLLLEHPICETSKDEYRLVRERMENFVISVEQGKDAEVCLTTQEINCLKVRGVTPAQTGSGAMNPASYFRLVGDEIQEFNITFFPFSKGGFRRETYSIEFTKDENTKFSQTRVITSTDGKSRKLVEDEKKSQPLNQSDLIDTILRMDKTLAWSESMAVVIERLTEVKVEDNKLILKAGVEVRDVGDISN